MLVLLDVECVQDVGLHTQEHLESIVKHGGLYLNGPRCVLWRFCTDHAVAQCRICTGFFCEKHENDHADICGEASPRAMAKLLGPKAQAQLQRRKQVREERCEKRTARFHMFVLHFSESPVAKALAEQQYACHVAHVRLSEWFARRWYATCQAVSYGRTSSRSAWLFSLRCFGKQQELLAEDSVDIRESSGTGG